MVEEESSQELSFLFNLQSNDIDYWTKKDIVIKN